MTFDEDAYALRVLVNQHEYQHALRRVLQRKHPDWFDGEILRPESSEAFMDEMVLRMGGIRRLARLDTRPQGSR